MTMDRLVAIIAVFMALVLAGSRLRSYQLDIRRSWLMGLGWLGIFIALVLLARIFWPESSG